MDYNGFSPQLREVLDSQAAFNAGDVAVVISLANVAPAPTATAWSYTVPFELQTSSGLVIPYTGNVAASAADTSSAGAASVGDATPAVVRGRGSVTFSGDAEDWLDTETATLTVTYTDAYASAHTDTFVVTFTA
jgi:hypothetical protein